MKWTVAAVGKIKEPFYNEACQEYIRRIRRYLPIEMTEAKSEERLLAPFGGRTPAQTELWALVIEGTPFSTEALAQVLGERMAQGPKEMAFLIGDADGLSKATLDRCQVKWSLGPITIAHRLARVVVLEQLYRVLTILRGEPYHHGGSGSPSATH